MTVHSSACLCLGWSGSQHSRSRVWEGRVPKALLEEMAGEEPDLIQLSLFFC